MIATLRMSILSSGGVVGRGIYAWPVTSARQVEEASCRCHSPPMRKRSVTIDGHRTSASLEDAFCTELSAIAQARGLSRNALVGEIDHARAAPGNLSGPPRLSFLEWVQKRTSSRV